MIITMLMIGYTSIFEDDDAAEFIHDNSRIIVTKSSVRRQELWFKIALVCLMMMITCIVLYTLSCIHTGNTVRENDRDKVQILMLCVKSQCDVFINMNFEY